MKELSIEGKATRYDEAIKMAKSKIKNDKDHVLYEDDVIEIFPELKESKESEDERIRKAIHIYLDWLDGRKDYAPKGEYTIKDMIAWIEKQGEHANFRNKIEIGDKVTRNEDGVLVNLSQLARVAKPAKNQDVQQETLCGKCRKEQPSHSCQDITALGRCAVEHEQKPAIFIPKFHVGDMIIHKELGGDYIHTPHKIIQVDILDKKYRLEGGLVAHFGEQDDYELVEQKPAWSEEDKVMLDKVIERLHKHSAGDKEYLDIYYWLIALKDRVQPQPKQEWKPSDEQIELLREVQQALLGKDCHNRFVNFMYELKRLMEE